MINDAVEVTFTDSMNCSLAYFDDNKKNGLYLLMKNVIVEVVKGGRIRALIGRLAARAVTKDEVLENLGKRLST